MTARYGKLAACIAMPLLVSACSTPQPVKDTTAHTAWMMRQLQQEMNRFVVARHAGDASMVNTLRDAQANSDQLRVNAGKNLRMLEAAGDTQATALLGRLKSAADGLQQDDLDLQSGISKLDADMSQLLKPLPNVSPKMSAAASAVTVLGQDLPYRSQFSETIDVMRGVWKNTKDNRDKLDKAMIAR